MSTDRKKVGHVKILHGRKHFAMRCATYPVVAAPPGSPPFDVDAIVLEEDTFLVMSAPPEVRDVKTPMMEIMTKLIETRPQRPGCVLVKDRSPLRFLAVIYDFNEEPICREEWVESALGRIWQETERRRLRSIGLPLLGTGYGVIGTKRSIEILKHGLKEIQPPSLERLWLIISKETGIEELKMMEELIE
ncbi:MAG: hypothetical protein JRH06_05380 [Deltaproteobacteria bacterium]|nr:hypothetical protein [Deltaproteobacteria bacterium]MBW2136969.1 hypothetical protein [Deltaproteobacteria bacterium]